MTDGSEQAKPTPRTNYYVRQLHWAESGRMFNAIQFDNFESCYYWPARAKADIIPNMKKKTKYHVVCIMLHVYEDGNILFMEKSKMIIRRLHQYDNIEILWRVTNSDYRIVGNVYQQELPND